MIDPEITTMDLYSLGEITMTARTPTFTSNAGASTLNTPDITAVNLEDIFNVPESILSSTTQDVETTPTTTAIEPEFEFVDAAMEQLEHESIWGQETFNTVFETNDFGLCAPASIVEGTIADENVTDDTVDVVDSNDFLQMENMDILQWVVNDQKIDFEIVEQKEEVKPERVSVIVPVASAATVLAQDEVKIENLSEDEKYRKMRDQNNEASKRCRAKRKRKHQEAEDELIFLQERNVELRAKMDEMEREVQILKKRFLTNISVQK